MKYATIFAAAAMATAANGELFYEETFSDGEGWLDRWVLSKWKGSDMGEFKVTPGEWYGDAEKDAGLQVTQDAKFYGATAKLPKSINNVGKDLVLQYSVKMEKKESSFCGGNYIKLLPPTLTRRILVATAPIT